MESWNEDAELKQHFEEMKNTLIHNCIGSHTNCFKSFIDIHIYLKTIHNGNKK